MSAKPLLCGQARMSANWPEAEIAAPAFVRFVPEADMAGRSRMTQMYGPAVRSKKISASWR